MNEETRRFDEAIEMLLNSRWLHETVVAAVFAYADGEISREDLAKAM